jgi:hypothetical protein
MAIADIEPELPLSVVVPVVALPVVPVEPETLPAVAPDCGMVLAEVSVLVVAPAVPPVVAPAEAEVLGVLACAPVAGAAPLGLVAVASGLVAPVEALVEPLAAGAVPVVAPPAIVDEPVPLVLAEALGVLGVEALAVVPVVEPIELVLAGAFSQVPRTSTLWPTCAARSCVVSICTPEGCLSSNSMNMPACCCRQPFILADLPTCSSLLAVVVLVASDWAVAPVCSEPVLAPDWVPPPAWANIAMVNASMTVHVSKIRFTLILLGVSESLRPAVETEGR